MNKVFEKDSTSPVIAACLQETVRVFHTTCAVSVIEDWTDCWGKYITCKCIKSEERICIGEKQNLKGLFTQK